VIVHFLSTIAGNVPNICLSTYSWLADTKQRKASLLPFAAAGIACFIALSTGCGGSPAKIADVGDSDPTPPPPDQHSMVVPTYHNDNSRSGVNTQETKLTPAGVNLVSFGRKAVVPVEGAIFAQPLYIDGVTMTDGKTHDLVVVATEHNQVYAIDADTYQIMWQRNFLGSQGLVKTAQDLFCGETFNSEIGITGTPVIDPSSETVYMVAVTKDMVGGQPQFAQTLYALRLKDGQNSVAPATISTPSGSQFGTATFDPLLNFQRAALLLANGNVYVSWASHCEAHAGWLMAFNATTLRLSSAWAPDPSGMLGGIWMAGGGPSADADGNIFLAVGNGWSDAQSGGTDYGDTVVRLRDSGNIITVADYFMPYDWEKLYDDDLDVGSGTPVLLPSQPGTPHPNLLITGDKEGNLYLLDRDNMGQWHPDNDDQVVQHFQIQSTGVMNTPVFWNNTLYYGLMLLPVQSFAYDPASQTINTTPLSASPTSLWYPGVFPSLSANNGSDAILWAVENPTTDPPSSLILRAFDASDLSTELYNSEMSPGRDSAGHALRFTVPTVANGQVFVGARDELDIYGVL